MITTTIPFAKLILSETNVRKSNGNHGIAALAASIAEHGLLQPLIVTPANAKKTKYAVHAGGRRWRAIGALIEAGTLPKGHEVEVRVCDDEATALREISLAENLLREAMTPADEARAYQAVIADGAEPEDVARRFGVTVRHVQGRLRLADLAEPIFTALAEGTITLDVAMAYGSTSDHARQLAAWERCSTSWEAGNTQAIRRAIAEESLSANHPIALFVGETDYVAAGGRIERDLFAGEGEGTWLDAALAQELANKKLTFEAEVAVLGTKLGWVKPLLATNVPHSESEQFGGYWPKSAVLSDEAQARATQIEAQLDELNEQIECADDEDAIEALSAEQEKLSDEFDTLRSNDPIIPDEDKPNVGTFLILTKDGKPVLVDRYYTTAKSARGGAGQPTNGGSGAADDGDGGEPGDALPRALEEQLAKDRRDILALHVAHDPALALDLAIFSLARDLAGHFGYSDTGCAIKIGDRYEPAGLKEVPTGKAADDLDAVRTSLPADWAQEADSFSSFLAFRALDEETRAAWLAYAVGQSLKASLASGTHRNAFQTSLGASIGIEPAQHWRPGAERFFDRLKKSQILSVLGTIDPGMPGRYATAKKGELASAATKLCAGESIVEPAIRERATSWIPSQLAFAAQPVENIDGEREASASGDDDKSVLDDEAHDDDPEIDHAAEILRAAQPTAESIPEDLAKAA